MNDTIIIDGWMSVKRAARSCLANTLLICWRFVSTKINSMCSLPWFHQHAQQSPFVKLSHLPRRDSCLCLVLLPLLPKHKWHNPPFRAKASGSLSFHDGNVILHDHRSDFRPLRLLFRQLATSTASFLSQKTRRKNRCWLTTVGWRWYAPHRWFFISTPPRTTPWWWAM